MTRRAAATLLLLSVLTVPLHADFSAVANAIDSQRGVNRVWIPFLGLARVAVRMVQPDGVHDFQLATFEGTDDVDPRELREIMRSRIGPGFHPLVQVWSKRSRDWSFIYARPSRDNERIELVILAHDSSDTVLVRVVVDADRVAREIQDHPRRVGEHARR